MCEIEGEEVSDELIERALKARKQNTIAQSLIPEVVKNGIGRRDEGEHESSTSEHKRDGSASGES